jgi:predicted neuraminidase
LATNPDRPRSDRGDDPDSGSGPSLPPPPAAGAALSRRHRLALCGLTLGAALIAVSDGNTDSGAAPAGLHPPTRGAALIAPGESTPLRRESWVTPSQHAASVHSSAICTLPSGDLLAVWYGGSREGAADVALFTARLPAGAPTWTAPVMVVDRALAASELARSVRKLGNAVIFPDGRGLVWMVYVSVSMGGWSGSSLNVKTSRDDGRTWSDSRRLTLAPFLNLSTLVRNKPILAADGRIGLPVYHELAFKLPQILWLTPGADGSVKEYRIRTLPAKNGLIQPALVALGADRVLMVLRDRSRERRMRTAYSDDNGWTWSEPIVSALPNPDSALDALRLRDGRILLVYNHAASGRENLQLAISADAGRTWRPGPQIEAAVRKEYSYPALLEAPDGRIHLTYTWERQRIKHVEFNLPWLDRGLAAREAVSQ